MCTELPTELQTRIVGHLGPKARSRVRRTSQWLRALVQLWERTAPEPLFLVLRVRPDTTATSTALMMTLNASNRAFHVVCSLPERTVTLLKEARASIVQTSSHFFQLHRTHWEQSIQKTYEVLQRLDAEGLLPRVRHWRFTCVTPVYGYLRSPDEFLDSLPFNAMLQKLVGLESVVVRLCMPSRHFNAVTNQLCCPNHGPSTLGSATLLDRLVRPALPQWIRLRTFALVDLSIDALTNFAPLAYLLMLVLTRDEALVDELRAQTPATRTTWLAQHTRPGALECLSLKRVSMDRHGSDLLWLILGAFPPKRRLILEETCIMWPRSPESVHVDTTGTIFPPAFLGSSRFLRPKPLAMFLHSHAYLPLSEFLDVRRCFVSDPVAAAPWVTVHLYRNENDDDDDDDESLN
jgi:hypothetical protein